MQPPSSRPPSATPDRDTRAGGVARRWTNAALLLVPVAIVGAVLALQFVIEELFLGTPAVAPLPRV
jgi:hypothetical protein